MISCTWRLFKIRRGASISIFRLQRLLVGVIHNLIFASIVQLDRPEQSALEGTVSFT